MGWRATLWCTRQGCRGRESRVKRERDEESLFGLLLIMREILFAFPGCHLTALLPVCTHNLQILINAFLERGQDNKVGLGSIN